MTATAVQPGVGIYDRPDAARLLGIPSARLRRWVDGYTYYLRSAARRTARKRAPVLRSMLMPEIDGHVALSFLELMELRVVKAILDTGVSLQQVRLAAAVAAKRHRTAHPFASRRVFTDGKSIFSAMEGDESFMVRWAPGTIDQLISGHIFRPFLQEIDFNERTSLAERWWPRGRREPVLLDPEISFGAPILEGTAVRTSVVAALAGRTSVREAAIAYGVELRKVEAALEFEQELAA